jgi:hypothetical protein
MNWKHYAGIVILLVVGYWLGTKYPGWLTKATGGIVAA